jgi:hypothetical protein
MAALRVLDSGYRLRHSFSAAITESTREQRLRDLGITIYEIAFGPAISFRTRHNDVIYEETPGLTIHMLSRFFSINSVLHLTIDHSDVVLARTHPTMPLSVCDLSSAGPHACTDKETS